MPEWRGKRPEWFRPGDFVSQATYSFDLTMLLKDGAIGLQPGDSDLVQQQGCHDRVQA